jgi:hypothetical protein
MALNSKTLLSFKKEMDNNENLLLLINLVQSICIHYVYLLYNTGKANSMRFHIFRLYINIDIYFFYVSLFNKTLFLLFLFIIIFLIINFINKNKSL